ncbi:MAG: dUTP diphosphatase [Gammaproteobacteria bacterium]|nr:dUTP diphosphatase [Gammaproteobacteria bacterium]
MLALQDEMNSRVDPDWMTRERAWYRAIWIECAELMDHYGGWKWWKASHRDLEQVMLEIVDIWHFGLSIRIPVDRDYEAAAARIVEEWCTPLPSSGFLRDVEILAEHALSRKDCLVPIVPTLLAGIGQDFDALYRSYIGKNVLNFFRQDHGYREGSYRKLWQGREDNVHLVEILAELTLNGSDLRTLVYTALSERYAAG